MATTTVGKDWLSSVCSAKTYKLIRNQARPRKPGDLAFKELVMLVQEHHNPKQSVIQVRHTHSHSGSFSCCICGRAETTFGILWVWNNAWRRDRLVGGINNDSIQCRLLGEATLTFKKVLQIAHAMETADMNCKDIQAANTSVPQSAVHCLLKKKRRRCRGAHLANYLKLF